MGNNRQKERLVSGYCDLPAGRIYFYGKTTSVSENQAHFNVCGDIKRCFDIDTVVSPVLTMCRTFSSSDFILRRVSPNDIEYYSDKDKKNKIDVVRKRKTTIEDMYGEDGEEIVDIDFD